MVVTVDYVKSALKRLLPILRESRSLQLSEGDTCVRVLSVLTDALGYDPFHDVAREYPVQAHRVDFAVKVDGTVRFFIEAKPMSIKLKETHVYQGANYAATEGIPWCLVTNGNEWQAYRISADASGVQHTLVLDVNLVDDDLDEVASLLYLLGKRAMQRKELDDYFEREAKLSPSNLLAALLEPSVLKAARRQIKAATGLAIDNEGLARALKRCWDPETVELAEAQIKRANARVRPRKPRANTAVAPDGAAPPPSG